MYSTTMVFSVKIFCYSVRGKFGSPAFVILQNAFIFTLLIVWQFPEVSIRCIFFKDMDEKLNWYSIFMTAYLVREAKFVHQKPFALFILYKINISLNM